MTDQKFTIYGISHPELIFKNLSEGGAECEDAEDIYNTFIKHDKSEETMVLKNNKIKWSKKGEIQEFSKMVRAQLYYHIYYHIYENVGCYYGVKSFFKGENRKNGRIDYTWFYMFFKGWELMKEETRVKVFCEFLIDKFVKQSESEIEAKFLELLDPYQGDMGSYIFDLDCNDRRECIRENTRDFWEDLLNMDCVIERVIKFANKYGEKLKREKEKKIALVIHTINTACWSPHTPLGVAMFNFRLKVDGLDELIV